MRRIAIIILLTVCISLFSGCSNVILPTVPTATPQAIPSVSSAPGQAGSHQPYAAAATPNVKEGAQVRSDAMPSLVIRVGTKYFPVTLYGNDTARAFVQKLPFTIEMDELNGNEKFYYFDEGFPMASERVGSIHSGDLMLYGADCLVLFYESFSTSYSYTRLGYVQEVTGLADALGNGQVQVTFELGE